MHGVDSLIGIQLSHAGRKAATFPPTRGRGSVPIDEGGWATVGPSPVAYGTFTVPEELDHDGIAKVIADHVSAAQRAVEAGFDLIELHAAHGYLLGQFLSPTSNHRTDEYGGGNLARAQLLREVIHAIRTVMPPTMPLVLRVSASEWVPDGVTVADTIEMLQSIDGVDLVSVSSGGNDPRQRVLATSNRSLVRCARRCRCRSASRE